MGFFCWSWIGVVNWSWISFSWEWIMCLKFIRFIFWGCVWSLGKPWIYWNFKGAVKLENHSNIEDILNENQTRIMKKHKLVNKSIYTNHKKSSQPLYIPKIASSISNPFDVFNQIQINQKNREKKLLKCFSNVKKMRNFQIQMLSLTENWNSIWKMMYHLVFFFLRQHQ